MNSLTRYVGIGSSNTISKIMVRWPSGIINQVFNPAPNQFLTIEEGGVCSDPNSPDTDNDGVCDAADQCPGYNDLLDSDNDGIPNDCDNDCDCLNQSATTTTFNIQTGTDDAEEDNAGLMDLASGDLDMVYDDNDLANAIKVGLRYQNISIPQGANIISANFQFQADEVASVAASFNIFIENNLNPASYSSSTNNISNRNYTANSISWSNVGGWTAIGQSGANQKSVDVSGLLTQIINDPNWNAGNAIAFKIEGSGYRTAESFEGNGTGPVLTIQYDESDCGDSDNDGIIDACDICPTINDNLIGTACEDGDACTTGEIYDDNCGCTGGTSSDSDNDGICDATDSNPNDPCVPNACPDCENVTFTITFDNYPQETSWELFNSNNTSIASGGTYPNAPDGSIESITNCLTTGCYYVVVSDTEGDGICCSYGNGSFEITNSANEVLAIGSEFQSSMTLDFCIDTQCQTVGLTCDDGDPCTTGETYNSTCGCTGGTVSTDLDNDGICDATDICPNFNDNLIGTVCDDGDACTTGETYNSNCECSGGVFTDSDNDGTCDGYDICPNFNDNLIGTVCEDGDACTTGETYDIFCNCSGGTVRDTDNDGVCDGEDVCTNGDDTIDADNNGIPDACDFVCVDFMIEANNRVLASGTTNTAIYIESNGVVNTGSNVSYKSGEYIELKSNFEVKQGASFSAEIGDCQ